MYVSVSLVGERAVDPCRSISGSGEVGERFEAPWGFRGLGGKG
jgi:hypothetical protein